MAAMFSRGLTSLTNAAQIVVKQCTQAYSSQKAKSFWELGKINHVAIATLDLKKSTALYRDILHAKVSPPTAMADHGVTVVFVQFGNTTIELLEPLGSKSPIKKFLERNPDGGLHHICIDVSDLKLAIEEVQRSNIRTLSTRPSIGSHGKPVIFLHPKDMGGVLIELQENFHEAYKFN